MLEITSYQTCKQWYISDCFCKHL